MHDFKYREVLFGKSFLEGLVLDLSKASSAALQPVIDAFLTNLNRISAHAVMPTQIAWKVRRDQMLADYATYKAKGKLEANLDQFPNADSADWKRYQEEFEKASTAFFSNITPEQNNMLLFKYGVQYVEILLEESKTMQDSMEALLSFIVLGSWTAFESLASDLWLAGVDNGPDEIVGTLILASKSFKSPDDNITPKKAHEVGVNARTNFGTFLKGTGKVSFQRLKDIQFWFGIAFGEQASKLFDETAEGYIFALSAFRNALTHSAGKADTRFVKQVAQFAEFRSIQINDPILLDGALVKKLQKASLELGTRLVQFVDNVLTPPPQTP
jgi:hypothetical protein